MNKYFIGTLLLLSCHSSHDSKTISVSSAADSSAILNNVEIGHELKQRVKLFDNQQAFEIVSFRNDLNTNTSDMDTLKCNRWVLTKPQIEKIIKNSQAINGPAWHYDFSVLACTISVNILQNGQSYDAVINAGSFFSISKQIG